MKAKLLAAIAVAASVCVAAPATAQNVQFKGSTQGCFGPGCTPTTGSLLNPVTDDALSYLSGGFNQYTDTTGFLGLGGASDNLGSFYLGNDANTYTGDLFTLLVNFTLPGTTSGSYSATLQGIVESGQDGSVYLNFDNTPQTITYNGGSFTLAVNDVSVSSNGLAQILSGQIQAVPEPATWAMMLLGFGAIGLTMRSRRRPALAQVA